jgi:hypothetical protein
MQQISADLDEAFEDFLIHSVLPRIVAPEHLASAIEIVTATLADHLGSWRSA